MANQQTGAPGIFNSDYWSSGTLGNIVAIT